MSVQHYVNLIKIMSEQQYLNLIKIMSVQHFVNLIKIMSAQHYVNASNVYLTVLNQITIWTWICYSFVDIFGSSLLSPYDLCKYNSIFVITARQGALILICMTQQWHKTMFSLCSYYNSNSHLVANCSSNAIANDE